MSAEEDVAEQLGDEALLRARFTAMPAVQDRSTGSPYSDELMTRRAVDAMQTRHYVETRGRIALQTWSIQLSPRVFQVVHQPGEATLRVVLDEHAPMTDGAHELRWEGVRELVFDLSPELIERIRRQGSAGELALRVESSLAGRSHYDRLLCEETSDGRTVVPMVLATGSLVERASGDVLAAAQTAHSAGVACSRAARDGDDDATPVVRVVGMESAGESDLSVAEATLLRALVESRLHRCYFEGIERNAAMRGALVLSFTLGREGTLQGVGVTLDAVDAPEMVRCAAAELERFVLPRGAGASEQSIRLTVVFRTD